MKKHIGRLIILGVLIMVCIWQTITLWLGNMSGHNFFGTDAVNHEISYIYPKEIWSNISGSVYKIEGSNDEADMRYKLLYELFGELKKENIRVELSPKISYAKLLSSTSGLIYEYGSLLTIDEMMGQSLKVTNPKYTGINNKYTSVKTSDLYIDMSERDRYKVYVYLIDEKGEVSQKITINKLLDHHNEAIEYYKNVEQIGGVKTYQASILSPNDSEMFKGNIFYPLDNQGIPIKYKEISLSPLIMEVGDKELENYVNDLFKNPAYKIETPVENGVTYSDNLNVSVIYNQVGTLEFKKSFMNDTEKSSSLERLSTINTFINESKAIPDFLKKGLYLDEIKTDEETRETRYLFGYQYNHFDVILSDQAKKELGVNTFLELVIKNSEIIRGKWIMLEPVPMIAPEASSYINTIAFQKESNEAISNILEQVEIGEEETFELEDLECSYIIEDIGESLKFDWVGYRDGDPILVNEKIDND